MKITKDFIDELKRRNRIEDVIGQDVSLKRSGSTLVGLCPFHSEKTPSFHIYVDDQNYFCFGCENGGDVITYIMNTQNLGYIDALNVLCKRCGMKTVDDSSYDTSTSENRQKVYAIYKESAKYFHDNLMNENNKEARDYVFVKRKLNTSVVNHFGLGYADDNLKDYLNHMGKQGYTIDDLVSSKMCNSDNGKVYPYFRNRIMFPIIDISGNVIGFGGRALGDKKPKYLNSTDSVIFKKSKNLYSLNYAKTTGKESIILCEGYMDVIGFNLAGITNCVATLGTALTDDQAKLLSRYTKRVIISYDSDDAGKNATKRAIPMLTNAGLDVVILRLDGAKDPDEYVHKFGAAKLKEAIEKSVGRIDYTISDILSKYNLNISDEKSKAAQELCRLAATQYSSIDREIYIDEITKRLGIDRKLITNEVSKFYKRNVSEQDKRTQSESISKLSGYSDKVNPDFAKNVKVGRAEEIILSIMMNYHDLAEKIRTGEIDLKEEDFKTSFGKRVFARLYVEDYFGESFFLNDFSLDEVSRITKIFRSRKDKTENNEEVLLANINILKDDKKIDLNEAIKRRRNEN